MAAPIDQLNPFQMYRIVPQSPVCTIGTQTSILGAGVQSLRALELCFAIYALVLFRDLP